MKQAEDTVREFLGADYTVERVIRESDRGHLSVLRRASDGEQLILRIFKGDANALARLAAIRNEHLPRVLEVRALSDAQSVLLLEEFIPGTTLFERIRDRRMSAAELKAILLQLTDALSALHGVGLIHNDIKPENVLLRGDRAVLIDFDSVTEDGAGGRMSGTRGYAPPEQYGGKGGKTADIYALGVLINLALTGKHPSAALADGRWGRIVEKCTMASPDRRFRNVNSLERAISGKSGRAEFAGCAAAAMLAVLAAITFSKRPKTYEGGAYVDYPLDGRTVRLALSFDTGSAEDGHATAELSDRLPTGMESYIPSQLYVYQEGNDSAQATFADGLSGCEVDLVPLEGAEQMETDGAETPDETFLPALRVANVYYHAGDGTNEIRWTLSMKNGDTIRLSQEMTCTEQAVLSYDYHEEDLTTVEAIRALLARVREEQNGTAIVKLTLPPVRYKEPLVLDEMAVSLVGTTDGDARTTFADTIEIRTRNPQLAELQGLNFEGGGHGAGLLAYEAVIVEDCAFSGWEVAADAEEGSWIIMSDCTFSDNEVGFRFNSSVATASGDVYEGLVFEENEVAVELLQVPGNMPLHFEDCSFVNNRKDFADEAGLAVR